MRFSEPMALLLWCLALLVPGPTLAEPRLIKLATLAPENNNWLKALRAFDADLRQLSDQALGLKIYPGGVQGDEEVMLRKLRVGQLHAVAFGGLGVSQTCPDVGALEIPFTFRSYDEVDWVLEQALPFYQRAYEQQGLVLLGWLDVGFIHILSQQPIRSAADARGLKVWRLEGEPITRVLFGRAGMTSVPLSIPDVLMGLQTNLIDVVYASPSAAIALQWFTRVRYLTALPINYTPGALLVDQRTFASLPADQQNLLRQLAEKHLRQQRAQNRKENGEALKVLEGAGITIVTPATGEIEGFGQLVQESLPDLVGKAFSQEAYDLVHALLAAYPQPPAARP
ncbi:MAG: TRAP transporter substrate-binding protein DctP [Candidatus Latescibacteria bacterium]|nr:TRAP transporter substrate-binding protein DctP [Candidatus Latescibacterota bacterium]